jgi:hypothetical protein
MACGNECCIGAWVTCGLRLTNITHARHPVCHGLKHEHGTSPRGKRTDKLFSEHGTERPSGAPGRNSYSLYFCVHNSSVSHCNQISQRCWYRSFSGTGAQAMEQLLHKQLKQACQLLKW